MYRYLRNLRIVSQIEEACELRRQIRRAEHRSALRLMRANVRSRIMYEINKEQMKQMLVSVQRARAYSRIHAATRVLMAQNERQQAIANALSERGLNLPKQEQTDTAEDNAEEFKKDMLKSVQQYVPTNAASNHANSIVQAIMQQSIGDAKLDGRADKADMSVGLAAGLAKELGLSKEELDDLLKHVEKDDGDVGLRDALMNELGEVEEKKQGQEKQS